MRKFPIFLFVCCLAFSLTCQAAIPTQSADTESNASSASNAAVWNNQETGYRIILEDDAGLLSKEERAQLASEMQDITAYGNAAFKTVTFNGTATADFARNYYYELFGQESGTLFLIDMDNRELYIFSNGAIQKIITTAYANTITDNVYRYASSENYYRCASEAFEQITALLSGHRIAQPMKYICNALLALILAALINYFIVRLCSASPKPSRNEILKSVSTKFTFINPQKKLLSQRKTYSPIRTSSGSSHSGRSSHHRSSGSSHRSSGGSSHRSSSSHRSGGGHRGGSGGGHRF